MEAAEDVEELHAEDCFRTWQFWKVCFLIFTMAIAREAQKFLIPLIGAESGLHTSFVGHVAFMSQMESLVAAPVGGFFMESLGIFPVVLVSLLLSAVGIQFLCMHGIRFYVQGASLLGLGCGLCAGAAIALSIVYAPEGPPSRKRSFLNGRPLLQLLSRCARSSRRGFGGQLLGDVAGGHQPGTVHALLGCCGPDLLPIVRLLAPRGAS